MAVYSSFRELKDGVDYWIQENARYAEQIAGIKGKKFMQTMFWVQYEMDYSPEPQTFDYAYIHPSEYETVRRRGIKRGMDPESYKSGGSFHLSNAGKNLITRLLHYDTDPSEKMLGIVGMGKRVRGLTSFR